MSRIGKAPIAVPEGVTVTIDGASIKVKGPKGELEQTIDPEIGVELNDNVLTFICDTQSDCNIFTKQSDI